MSTFGGLLRRAPRAREPDRVDQANLPPDGWHTPPGSAGAGVTVHVSGTGIRFPHREFGGRARCGGAVPDVGATASDGGGHGTRGTATVVGGRSGAARKAQVAGVPVRDDAGRGGTADVIAGIERPARDARGPAACGNSPRGPRGPRGPRPDAAAHGSVAAGIIRAAADDDRHPAGPRSPGRVRRARTAGAADRRQARAAPAGFGPAPDPCAPGVSITSPTGAGDTARASRSGTPAASPHVAGAAAGRPADRPRAAPARAAGAAPARAVCGGVSGRGPGPPDELLRTPGP